MDSSRGGEAASSGNAKSASTADVPEQLLDVFKAAALSVTKLYRTSAANESRARTEGYQECLDDLLGFLDKEAGSLSDPSRSRLRKWATDRHDGRDRMQTIESDDEVEKNEPASSPEPPAMTESAPPPPVPASTEREPYHFVVPTQDTFSMGSQYPNIATLDLSDSRQPTPTPSHSTPRSKGRSNISGKRSSSNLGRGAGNKRRHDWDDFWGGAFGGKDTFNGPKRGRHS